MFERRLTKKTKKPQEPIKFDNLDKIKTGGIGFAYNPKFEKKGKKKEATNQTENQKPAFSNNQSISATSPQETLLKSPKPSENANNQQIDSKTQLTSQQISWKLSLENFPEPKNQDELLEQAQELLLKKETAMLAFGSITAMPKFYQQILKLKDDKKFANLIEQKNQELRIDFFDIIENQKLVVADSNELVLADCVTKMSQNSQNGDLNYYQQIVLLNKICDSLVNFILFSRGEILGVSKFIAEAGKLNDSPLALNNLKFNRQIYCDSEYKKEVLEALIALNEIKNATEKEIKTILSNFDQSDDQKPESKQYLEAFYKFEDGQQVNQLQTNISEKLFKDTENLLGRENAQEMFKEVIKNPANYLSRGFEIVGKLLENVEIRDFETEIELIFENFETKKRKEGGDLKTSKQEFALILKDSLLKKQEQKMYENRLKLLNNKEWVEKLTSFLTNSVPIAVTDVDPNEIKKMVADFEIVKKTKGDISKLGFSSQKLILFVQQHTNVLFLNTQFMKNGERTANFDAQLTLPEFISNNILLALNQILEKEEGVENYVDKWQTIEVGEDAQEMLKNLPEGVKKKAIRVLDEIDGAKGLGLYRLKVQSNNANDYGMKETRGDIERAGVKKGDLEIDISSSFRMFLRGNNTKSKLVYVGDPHTFY